MGESSAGAAINSALKTMSPQMQTTVLNYLQSPNYDALRLNQAVTTMAQPQAVAQPQQSLASAAPMLPAAVLARFANPQSEEDRSFAAEKMQGLAMAMGANLSEQTRQQLTQAAKLMRSQLSAQNQQKLTEKMGALAKALGKSAEIGGMDSEASAVQGRDADPNSFARQQAKLSKPAAASESDTVAVYVPSPRKAPQKTSDNNKTAAPQVPLEKQITVQFLDTVEADIEGGGVLKSAVTREDIAEVLAKHGLKVLEVVSKNTARVAVSGAKDAAEVSADLEKEHIVFFATPRALNVPLERQIIVQFRNTVGVDIEGGGVARAEVTPYSIAEITAKYRLRILDALPNNRFLVRVPKTEIATNVYKKLAKERIVLSATLPQSAAAAKKTASN
jgi:hypothetical protein